MMRLHRPQMPDPAEQDRLEMAREILETGKKMELQGLKAILQDTIENPMIPSSAREHAEHAFQIAADLESDDQWRSNELNRWAAARRVKIVEVEGKKTAVSEVTGKKVVVPEYIFSEPRNLKRRLDYEVAEIGMMAVETVYNDILAGKFPAKRMLGVMQEEEDEVSHNE